MWFKHDPGPCPVDDCPHHTCVAPEPPTVTLLPARDAESRAVLPRRRVTSGDLTPSATAFSTATFRGWRRRP